jgi:phage gpG-like protein
MQGGDFPGLKKLQALMAGANGNVLVGVPAGATEEVKARANAVLEKRRVNRAAKRMRKGQKTTAAQLQHFAVGGDEREVSLPVIAAIHEFGSPEHGIPERSFLRTGVRRGLPKFHALNAVTLKKVVEGKMTFDQAREKLGVVAVGEVKREFTVGKFVPLKPATIKRKGSSRPLIDSGQLRQSITYQLEGQQSANARII